MSALLRVEGVSKSFHGIAALRGVSFEVEEGKIYGLIGPNGAGKTTLLSLIAGSARPSSGQIFFREKDITGIPSFHAVRLGIVRTHQIPRPFASLSVLENVEVGLRFGRGRRSRRPSEAEEVLEHVGLGRFASAPAHTLSVGDQKRFELARALATRPSLLLCDEVCCGLTGGEAQSILRLLTTIRDSGTTLLYVEHNLRAVLSVCDRVVVLNHGEKLAEGAPEAVRNDPGVIAAYIGADAGDS